MSKLPKNVYLSKSKQQVMSYYLEQLKSMHINTNKAQIIYFQSHYIYYVFSINLTCILFILIFPSENFDVMVIIRRKKV